MSIKSIDETKLAIIVIGLICIVGGLMAWGAGLEGIAIGGIITGGITAIAGLAKGTAPAEKEEPTA